jgi:hypothetical protein
MSCWSDMQVDSHTRCRQIGMKHIIQKQRLPDRKTPRRSSPTPKDSDYPIAIVTVLPRFTEICLWLHMKTSFPNVHQRSHRIFAIPQGGSTENQIFKGLGKGCGAEGGTSIGIHFPGTTISSYCFATAVHGSTAEW